LIQPEYEGGREDNNVFFVILSEMFDENMTVTILQLLQTILNVAETLQ